MLDNRMLLHQSINSDDQLQMRRQATQMFTRIHFRAQLLAFLRSLFCQQTHLKSLNENNNENGNGRSFTKPQYILIDQIEGSEGRSRDFDVDFRPLRRHIQDRWINIALACARGVQMPPVDLIQVGDAYFVRDGHHRISVAKANGQKTIDALVTVL